MVSGSSPLPGEPDERIDVLRMQLLPPARSGPGTRFCQVSATASAGSNPPSKPMSSTPVGSLRPAAELPLGLAQRHRDARLALELLQVGLARPVGIRLGEGELGVHVEQRRRGGRPAGQLVEHAGDASWA